MKGVPTLMMKEVLHWDPDCISHLETLGFFAFSLQIPVVYSAARGRAEIIYTQLLLLLLLLLLFFVCFFLSFFLGTPQVHPVVLDS